MIPNCPADWPRASFSKVSHTPVQFPGTVASLLRGGLSLTPADYFLALRIPVYVLFELTPIFALTSVMNTPESKSPRSRGGDDNCKPLGQRKPLQTSQTGLARVEDLSFGRWKQPRIIEGLNSVFHKAAQVWRTQRVCNKSRLWTRAKARHLAKVNTKFLY